jgi:hypothetical protein
MRKQIAQMVKQKSKLNSEKDTSYKLNYLQHQDKLRRSRIQIVLRII